MKALGDNMVLTCKVVTSDGRPPPPGSRLRWLDDDDHEISDVTGRSDSTGCFSGACWNEAEMDIGH